MPFMVVTLDVSKLSDWLNALAHCRVERGDTTRGEGGPGEVERRGVVAAQAAFTGGGAIAG